MPNMVASSPALRRRVEPLINNLHVAATAARFMPLSFDSSTMDGLNVHGAVIDELHAHNLRKRAERERVPYDLWAAQGFIEATPGDVVDYSAVETRIRADAALFAGKSTLNRLEHAPLGPSRYQRPPRSGRIQGLFVDLFLWAHQTPLQEIILDLDATDDPLHGRHLAGSPAKTCPDLSRRREMTTS
jgi:hypothetical protein